MTAAKKAAATIADAIASARADLDQLRDRIVDLLAERYEIEHAPCDLAEADRRVGEIIKQARASTIFYQPGLFASTSYGSMTPSQRPCAAINSEPWQKSVLTDWQRPSSHIIPAAACHRMPERHDWARSSATFARPRSPRKSQPVRSRA